MNQILLTILGSLMQIKVIYILMNWFSEVAPGGMQPGLWLATEWTLLSIHCSMLASTHWFSNDVMMF